MAKKLYTLYYNSHNLVFLSKNCINQRVTDMYFYNKRALKCVNYCGAWTTLLVEQATLAGSVMSSSPMLGVETTLRKCVKYNIRNKKYTVLEQELEYQQSFHNN